ncbi:hypothetical protein DMENIID0001_125640 [Sergentomyia squamirostris]
MIVHRETFIEILINFDYVVNEDDSWTGVVRRKHLQENSKQALLWTRVFLTFVTLTGITINTFDLIQTNFTAPMLFLIPGLPSDSFFFRPVSIIFQVILYFAILDMIMISDCVIMITICYYRAENLALVEIIDQLNDPEKDASPLLCTINDIYQQITDSMKDLLVIYWHLYFHKLITIVLYLCSLLFVFQSLNTNVLIAFICAMVVVGQIFILCFFGQLLQSSSEVLSSELYMTNWYELEQKDKRNFLLLLMRFQRPARIDTFGFGAISIYTFVQILKAAVSYASIAYTVFK